MLLFSFVFSLYMDFVFWYVLLLVRSCLYSTLVLAIVSGAGPQSLQPPREQTRDEQRRYAVRPAVRPASNVTYVYIYTAVCLSIYDMCVCMCV